MFRLPCSLRQLAFVFELQKAHFLPRYTALVRCISSVAGPSSSLKVHLAQSSSCFSDSKNARAICAPRSVHEFQKRRLKLDEKVNLNDQTRELPDGSRVAAYLGGDELRKYMYQDAQTLYEAVRRGMRHSKNGRMLGKRVKQPDGSRPYVWLSYQEVIEKSENLCYGLLKLGIKPGQGTLVGIYSRNRPECIIAELAAYSNSSPIVPIYDTLGEQSRTYIIQLCDIEVIVCDTEKKARDILESVAKCPRLKHIVIMDGFDPNLPKLADQYGVQVHHFEEVEELGRQLHPKPPLQLPKPEDLCCISFTSGTTGLPKGVMLTHGNVIADCTVYLHRTNILADGTDVIVSYLPLAHMYERVIHFLAYQHGESIGFFSGDIQGLVDDLRELRPTVVPLVPRVLTRIVDLVRKNVEEYYIKRKLFNMAVGFKTRELDRGIVRNDSMYDKFVLKEVREVLGGRVRLMMTGSAPLAEEVLRFARAAMGCVIFEGYGQTECVAACTAAVEADQLAGHVGIPAACCAIKLVDVPELGYFAKDQAGEVCVKGNNVFKGYYKDEEKTRETIDKEGWLHTGDIGKWNKNGTLSIVDRKKHIFKLQQGEYVAPEKIENIYARSPLVAQSFVHGDSMEEYLVAIIVPEQKALETAVLEKLHLQDVSFEKMCEMPEVKQIVVDELNEVGKKAGLTSFEQVKKVYLSKEHFTPDNGLLTPTLKTKRPQIHLHFADEIAKMYNKSQE